MDVVDAVTPAAFRNGDGEARTAFGFRLFLSVLGDLLPFLPVFGLAGADLPDGGLLLVLLVPTTLVLLVCVSSAGVSEEIVTWTLDPTPAIDAPAPADTAALPPASRVLWGEVLL